jgi:hypothetical protein
MTEMMKLTPLRRHILEYAKRFPNFNPTNTARKTLEWLVKNDLIEGTNSNPTAAQRWRLTPAGRAILKEDI